MDGGWCPSVALHFVQLQAENLHGCGFSAAQGIEAEFGRKADKLERIARFLRSKNAPKFPDNRQLKTDNRQLTTDCGGLTKKTELDKVLRKINAMPMKCLGFRTPYEVLSRHTGVALAG
jgi:hypothetical protein